MSEIKSKRLAVLAKEYNISVPTIVKFLEENGVTVENDPNKKVAIEGVELVEKHFKDSKAISERASQITEIAKENKKVFKIEEEVKPPSKPVVDKTEIKATTNSDDEISANQENINNNTESNIGGEDSPIENAIEKSIKSKSKHEIIPLDEEIQFETNGPKILGKIDLSGINQNTRPKAKTEAEKEAEQKIKKEKRKEKHNEERGKDAKGKHKEKTAKIEEPADLIEESFQNDIPDVTNISDEIIPVKQEEVFVEDPNKEEFLETVVQQLKGPKIVDKINLTIFEKPKADPESKKTVKKEVFNDRKKTDFEKKKNDKIDNNDKKEKRNRINNVKVNLDNNSRFADNKKRPIGKPIVRRAQKAEISEKDIQNQVRETLATLTSPKVKSKSTKYKREKRDTIQLRENERLEQISAESKILKVTEFITTNEFATMMNVPITQVISKFMELGKFVSMNQRIDAEDLSLIADEFGFEVQFVDSEISNEIEVVEDDEDDLVERPPIVTVMGHVDHGKTKLLDFIRSANVVAGEAGGITQHIGAYSVKLSNGKNITFLDTPGHEAFTAMRARGAQITDVVIIVIAADDNVMPQTKEAINHASAAGVPIVFAINKIDAKNANPEKIKEQLSNMKYLVEDWGGKYQSQEISAKQGINIDKLLEKVMLEAEILDLKANPDKNALGTIVESSLEKRGYVATLIVQAGTLKIGDIVLAGTHFGKVKAMYNEKGKELKTAGPSTPILVLGLNGAPQAGDKFNVLTSEQEARSIANKRARLLREQTIRTRKHITLEEIGRRLALNNFNEIQLIVKGDVDGSVEALTDSLMQLSTESFNVNIIHAGIGQIIDSDVSLAIASNAIIIGFNVRPSVSARKMAEQENIEIRIYSIIYDAIEDTRDAMRGMLSPTYKEMITGNAEVKEVYKINKVGTIAGCMVTFGKINKKSKVHLLREGKVVYTGDLASLKRFKDDAKEVTVGLECGLSIDKFNDIKPGDIIEAFERTEEAGKL